MSEKFSLIFEPLKIGSVEIKNRIAMAPMGLMGLLNRDGTPTKRWMDCYIERARGGTGLIITGAFQVENDIEGMVPGGPIMSHAILASFAELAETVHALGSKVFIQLGLGCGRVGPPIFYQRTPPAPSEIPNYWEPQVTCRELKIEEIEQKIRAAGKAAEICAMAGVDGVEIHAMHEGYLIDQFAISLFNKRTDRYGGDLVGRLRFATEIVQEIKSKVAKDFPVILRFSVKSYIKDLNKGALPGEEFEEKGRDIEEALEAAKILEKAGYDAFDADAGTYDSWYWAHPPNYQKHGLYLPLTEQLKKVVKVPVIVAGRMDIPDMAEKAIAEGKADMVALGRGLLAEPHWVKKLQRNKTEHVRPCLGCHDGCVGRLLHGRPVCCAVNPAAGREHDYELRPSLKPQKVIVIGGGVAGLEAARVASLRGHRVTLFEMRDSLGGHLVAGSVPEFKKDTRRLLNWYKAEFEDLDIDVKLRAEFRPEFIGHENDDVVFIVATGSKPCLPDIPGIDRNIVATASEVLLGKKRAGEKVVIVGGGLVGCETALWLAEEGRQVCLVEMLGDLMIGSLPVPHPNRIMLIDLLKLKKVRIMTNHTLCEVKEGSVCLAGKNLEKQEIEADTVVLSVGLNPNNKIYNVLSAKTKNLYLIGDAREPRNIMGAIWDAYEVSRSL
jgi:2-enoate reductase